MLKIASKRFYILWAIVLMICVSPLGGTIGFVGMWGMIVMAVGLSMLGAMLCVPWKFLKPESYCWLADGWIDTPNGGASTVSPVGALAIMLGMLLLSYAVCAWRARKRGDYARMAFFLRWIMNLLFAAAAFMLSARSLTSQLPM